MSAALAILLFSHLAHAAPRPSNAPGVPASKTEAPRKKGADKDFPGGYLGSLYRQTAINAELKRREFPYRVYRNQRDATLIAVRKTPRPNEFESVAWAHGDRAKGPALAFGSIPRSPEDRQELFLEYALWILEMDEAEVYTDAFDPYKAIGRWDKTNGTLVFDRVDRTNDLFLWLGKGKPEGWAASVQKALADAQHAEGHPFKRLEGQLKDGKWTFGLRTTKTRTDGGAPVFYSE